MPIVIDLKMQNAGTDRALSRLEKALDRLDAALNRVNKAIAGTAGAVNGLAGSVNAPSGSRGGGGGSRSRKPVFNSIQDEIQWLRQQPGWRAQAQADQLQRRLALQSNDPKQQLIQALMRSRFVNNGGKMNIMPLGRDLSPGMMQLMGIMGGGAQAGGATMMGGAGAGAAGGVAALANPIGIAAAAIAAFAIGVAKATVVLNDMARNWVSNGGSFGQSQSAARIAALTGVDASSFSGNLPGTAAAAGINPIGGPFGDMNYSEKLRKAARFVARARSLDDARRRAAMVGSPELANTYLLRPDQQKWMQKQGMQNEGEAKRAAQLMADLQIAWANFSTVFVKLATPFVATLSNIGRTFAWLMDKIEAFADWIRNKLGLGGNEGGKKSPLDRNTEATDQLTRAMKDVRETLGGGPRAQGALPGKFRNGISGDLRDLRLANI